MKATFILLTLLGLLISCDSSDTNKSTSDSVHQDSDTLSYELKVKKDPCYKFYRVYVDNDSVTLEFGSDNNDQFVDISKKTEDEEMLDTCEYASFWTFRFDGQKLHFEKQLSAG